MLRHWAAPPPLAARWRSCTGYAPLAIGLSGLGAVESAIREDLGKSLTCSRSTSQKSAQIAETSNKFETHVHIEMGIFVHSQPSVNMPMQPLHFLQYCCSCNLVLGPETEIYIYKGESAFCSTECREKVMMIDHASRDN